MKKIVFVLLVLFGCLSVGFAENESMNQPERLSQRADVAEFIFQMVTKHRFSKATLEELFDQVILREKTISHIKKPAEAMKWYKYEKRVVKPETIQKGVEFWKAHEKELARAEKKYGVPASIILGILGIETKYGTLQGKFRVIDAIATVAFNYPSRSRYFKFELEQLLLLSRDLNISPLSLKGSYAGAMGMPQFMPSSYRDYAVDFSRSGTIDLTNDPADAIGSIAYYFKRHGWKTDKPVVEEAFVHKDKDEKYKDLDTQGKQATVEFKRLGEYGIEAKLLGNRDDLVGLIALEGEGGVEYWIAFQNFYVITRYNHSKLYAMAVYELSEGIKALKNKQT